MKKFIDVSKPFKDQLENYLNQAYQKDLLDNDPEEVMDFYEGQREKLAYVEALAKMSSDRQRKYVELVDFLNSIEASEARKLDCLLTYPCILGRLSIDFRDMTASNAMLLSALLNSVPFENYEMYGRVIGHCELLQMIEDKADQFGDQMRLGGLVLDYCDSYTENDMTAEREQLAVTDSISIVNAFRLDSTKQK